VPSTVEVGGFSPTFPIGEPLRRTNPPPISAASLAGILSRGFFGSFCAINRSNQELAYAGLLCRIFIAGFRVNGN